MLAQTTMQARVVNQHVWGFASHWPEDGLRVVVEKRASQVIVYANLTTSEIGRGAYATVPLPKQRKGKHCLFPDPSINIKR